MTKAPITALRLPPERPLHASCRHRQRQPRQPGRRGRPLPLEGLRPGEPDQDHSLPGGRVPGPVSLAPDAGRLRPRPPLRDSWPTGAARPSARAAGPSWPTARPRPPRLPGPCHPHAVAGMDIARYPVWEQGRLRILARLQPGGRPFPSGCLVSRRRFPPANRRSPQPAPGGGTAPWACPAPALACSARRALAARTGVSYRPRGPLGPPPPGGFPSASAWDRIPNAFSPAVHFNPFYPACLPLWTGHPCRSGTGIRPNSSTGLATWSKWIQSQRRARNHPIPREYHGMHYNDHWPHHFRAKYAGHQPLSAIATGKCSPVHCRLALSAWFKTGGNYTRASSRRTGGWRTTANP